MIKKSKGFTLVELLAVIVILSIIALISTPIILNIIEGARKDAAKASAMGYERAVNLKIMDGELTGNIMEDRKYSVDELDLAVSGKLPDEGEVTIEEKEVVEYTLRFGEYTVTKTKDGSVTVAKGEDDSKDDKLKAQEVITKLVPEENNTKESGDGTIENLGKYGIRYRGKDPENYVEFNGDVWRIIGIVDGYVKIISEPLKDDLNEIFYFSWDNKDESTGAEYEGGKNDWTEARLMKLLNPNYSGETYGGSLYWNSGEGQCYAEGSNATIDCNFTKTGLKKDAQDMIENITWKLGGWNTSDITAKEMYEKERGMEVYPGRKTEWQGKVGLMYLSDYGLASPKECTKTLSEYNASGCADKNWLFKNDGYFYWTLTPDFSEPTCVFLISSDGGFNASTDASNGNTIRPTVHLKKDVKIIDGDGSKEKPYKLSYEVQ